MENGVTGLCQALRYEVINKWIRYVDPVLLYIPKFTVKSTESWGPDQVVNKATTVDT